MDDGYKVLMAFILIIVILVLVAIKVIKSEYGQNYIYGDYKAYTLKTLIIPNLDVGLTIQARDIDMFNLIKTISNNKNVTVTINNDYINVVGNFGKDYNAIMEYIKPLGQLIANVDKDNKLMDFTQWTDIIKEYTNV